MKFSKLFQKEKPAIDYVIVGLGNVGDKYRNNRHNAGFMAIDYILDELSILFGRVKWNGQIFDGRIGDARVLFVKPHTYMNRSGECVFRVAKFYNIPPERLLIIYDDVELPPGDLRIRKKGTDGGHNGIKSIIQFMASYDIPRIRIGIGKGKADDADEFDLGDWVLGDFTKAEKEVLTGQLERVFEAVKLICAGKIDEAMNRYN